MEQLLEGIFYESWVIRVHTHTQVSKMHKRLSFKMVELQMNWCRFPYRLRYFLTILNDTRLSLRLKIGWIPSKNFLCNFIILIYFENGHYSPWSTCKFRPKNLWDSITMKFEYPPGVSKRFFRPIRSGSNRLWPSLSVQACFVYNNSHEFQYFFIS